MSTLSLFPFALLNLCSQIVNVPQVRHSPLMNPRLVKPLAAKPQTPYNGSKAGITVSSGPTGEGMLTGYSCEAYGVKPRCGVGDEGSTRERVEV